MQRDKPQSSDRAAPQGGKMNNPAPQPFLDPPDHDQGSFLPSLCTHTAQVPDYDCNPIQRKDLYKQEAVKWLVKNGFWADATKLEECGTSFVHLECSNGHRKYVRLYCKREFCPTCGEIGSREHKKRTTRARDRLMWAPVLGYMVFTLPDSISISRPDPEILKSLQKETCTLVTRHFDSPGTMNRMHFVGKHIGKLHIHFNVLFPILNSNGIGRIDPNKLKIIRKEWTDIVNKYFKTSFETTNIHYNFAATNRKKSHKIKYVLRPVTGALEFYALSNEDKLYILSLKGWHNTRWFGKISNNSYKKYLLSMNVNPLAYQESDSYLSRCCPVCSGDFKYQGIIHKNDLPESQLRWLEHDVLVDLEIFAALRETKKEESEAEKDTSEGAYLDGAVGRRPLFVLDVLTKTPEKSSLGRLGTPRQLTIDFKIGPSIKATGALVISPV